MYLTHSDVTSNAVCRVPTVCTGSVHAMTTDPHRLGDPVIHTVYK